MHSPAWPRKPRASAEDIQHLKWQSAPDRAAPLLTLRRTPASSRPLARTSDFVRTDSSASHFMDKIADSYLASHPTGLLSSPLKTGLRSWGLGRGSWACVVGRADLTSFGRLDGIAQTFAL